MRCYNRESEHQFPNGSFHFLFSQENICYYECGEDYGDYAVHGEERGVQTGEIVGLDQGMFVKQQKRDRDDAGDGEFAQSEGWEQGDQQEQHDEMEGASDPESALDAGVARDGVESRVAVELEILASVEDVEASDPKSYGGGKDKDARVEGTANGDPGSSGRYAERESEHEVRPARE